MIRARMWLGALVAAGIGAWVGQRRARNLLRHAPGRVDPLTAVATRPVLLERLDHALATAARTGRDVGVLFLDLDGFKALNDRYHHHIGDQVLQAVAERLEGIARRTDLVSRFGGDEFVILVEQVAGAAGAAAIADRALAELRRPFRLDDLTLSVTASVGIALSTAGGDARELLRLADEAMYAAKAAGGDTSTFATPELRRGHSDRRATLTALRQAFDRGSLRLDFQPQLDLTSGQVTVAEAFLRWDRDPGEAIPAAQFIDITEGSELAEPLGRWVLDTAVAEAARWHTEMDQDLAVAVNIGERHLRSGTLADDVAASLAAHGLPAHLLQVEVAEVAVAGDPDRVAEHLATVAALGVAVVLDRFGTGGLSLSWLARLPLTAVKPDESVVAQMDEEDGMLAGLVGLAHGLGLQVIVPQMERTAQLQRALTLGCHRAQGFVVARPLGGRDLTADPPIALVDDAVLRLAVGA